ncbi:MAG: hypothetical protein ACYC5M_02320 [Anaerolineae bacterium]
MQTFPRTAIHGHTDEVEWPPFLGLAELCEPFVVETERFSPVNGPIAIAGVRAGEGIAVHIEAIEPVGPFELTADESKQAADRPPIALSLRDECFYFPGDFRVRARPTVGNIAVLPHPTDEVLALARRAPRAGWRYLLDAPRGRHCHQDCPEATEGTIVHLCAQVDGVGLCVGDVHGFRPTGALAHASLEISANVRLRVERSQGWSLDWPLIETPEEIVVVVSFAHALHHGPRPTRAAVLREAYTAMTRVVAGRAGCAGQEAESIVAAAVSLRDCIAIGYDGEIAAEDGWAISVAAALPKASFSQRCLLN